MVDLLLFSIYKTTFTIKTNKAVNSINLLIFFITSRLFSLVILTCEKYCVKQRKSTEIR
jgi:hypothetical protein